MSLNKQIREKLEEVDKAVFYGRAKSLTADTPWNYMVYHRVSRTASTNKTGKGYMFRVAIVRENEIPEGLDDEVIEKVTSIPGVRLAGDADYAYDVKGATETAVEVISIPFVKAEKMR